MATTKATKEKKTTATKPAVKAAPKAAPKKAVSEGITAMAVIATGGKQYKVRVGDIIKIEKINGDHKVGDTISFDQVLLVDDAGTTSVGNPNVAGASVKAELQEIGRADKVVVIHYKQKSKYFKKYGHRQPYFKIAITSIVK